MRKQLAYALSVQIISIFVSLITVTLLPKHLGVDQYGQVQYYILIIGYAGLLHAGINDGAYICLGKPGKITRFKKVFSVLLSRYFAIEIFICSLLALSVDLLLDGAADNYILYMVCVAIPAINTSGLIGNVLQAGGNVNIFVTATLLGKLIIIFAILALIAVDVNDAYYIIFGFIASSYAVLVFLLWDCRIYKNSKPHVGHKIYKMAWLYIQRGWKILAGNYIAMLLSGSILLVIKINFGISEFAFASLAFTITSIFILLITQFGTVAYPKLWNMLLMHGSDVVVGGLKIVEIFTVIAVLGCMPIALLIDKLMPNYSGVENYLLVFFAIAIYDSYSSGILIPLLKISKSEKIILKANIMSAVVGSAMGIFTAWCGQSAVLVAGCMVLGYAARMVLLFKWISYKFGIKLMKLVMPPVILSFTLFISNFIESYSRIAAFLALSLVCAITLYKLIKTYRKQLLLFVQS